MHNVQNAMFAAAMAFSMGLKLEDIRHGLRTFDTTFFQAPGRMNIFDEHPFKVILDYGHNAAAVEAMCAARRAARRPAAGGSACWPRPATGATRTSARSGASRPGASITTSAGGTTSSAAAAADEVPQHAPRRAARRRACRPSEIEVIPDEQEATEAALRAGAARATCCSSSATTWRVRGSRSSASGRRTPNAGSARRPRHRPAAGPVPPQDRPREYVRDVRGVRFARDSEGEDLNRVIDSRRLTGPHLMGDRPGAALDVAIGGDAPAAADAWRREARRLLDRVGWEGEELSARVFPGGASLVISAPADGLYAATDLNEAAWDAAAARLDGREPPDQAEVAGRLRELIVREHDPRLRALRDAARARGVTFLADDDFVSVGSGSGTRVWSRGEFPLPTDVDWHAVHDIPIVLVSGSNGKTTSARLIAAIARASGLSPAITSTDGVTVAGEQLADGDYAGPMGARLALRDSRADIAVLETARGGILRRGLAVEHADATLLTNVASDHLDDFGVNDLATLAAVKLVAARVVRPTGRVVLNADDPGLAAHALGVSPASWFALDRATPLIGIGLTAGGDVAYVEDGALVLAQGGRPLPLIRLDQVPITLGGAARYNVSNALGAVLVSAVLAELPGRAPSRSTHCRRARGLRLPGEQSRARQPLRGGWRSRAGGLRPQSARPGRAGRHRRGARWRAAAGGPRPGRRPRRRGPSRSRPRGMAAAARARGAEGAADALPRPGARIGPRDHGRRARAAGHGPGGAGVDGDRAGGPRCRPGLGPAGNLIVMLTHKDRPAIMERLESIQGGRP